MIACHIATRDPMPDAAFERFRAARDGDDSNLSLSDLARLEAAGDRAPRAVS